WNLGYFPGFWRCRTTRSERQGGGVEAYPFGARADGIARSSRKPGNRRVSGRAGCVQLQVLGRSALSANSGAVNMKSLQSQGLQSNCKCALRILLIRGEGIQMVTCVWTASPSPHSGGAVQLLERPA